ncbi:MAG: hypothetical protein AAF202_01005, partial [Pseudomonadota bacterium]
GAPQQSIGSFSKVESDVRKRQSLSLSWYNVSSGEWVFEDDTVFTGSESSTTINLQGTQLELGANSLVVLKKAAGGVLLDLKLGRMKAKAKGKKTLRLLQAGKIAKLSSQGTDSQVVVSKNRAGEIKVVASRGQVSFESGATKETLQERDVVEISPDFEIEKESLPIELTEPVGSVKTFSKPGDPVVFRWQGQIPANAVLQVSPRFDFEQIEFSVPVEKKGEAQSLLGRSGIYFWRIVRVQMAEGQQNLERLSPVAEFSHVRLEPLKLIYPRDGMVIDSVGPKNHVRLRFEDRPLVAKYEVEWTAESGNFSDRFSHAVMSSKAMLDLNGLGHGTYSWRVRPALNEVESSPWSPVYRFSIADRSKPPVTAQGDSVQSKKVGEESLAKLQMPSLKPSTEIVAEPLAAKPTPSSTDSTQVLPEKGKQSLEAPKLSRLKRFQLKYSRSKTGKGLLLKKPPVLSWKSDMASSDTFFEVQVAKNGDFKKPVFSTEVRAKKITWKSAQPGQYQWRVRAKESRASRVSEWSRPSDFVAFLAAPQLEKTRRVSLEVATPEQLNQPQSFDYSWDPVLAAESYQLQVSKDPSFRKAKLIKNSKEAQITINEIKSSGLYYTRVRAVNSIGQAVSPFSKTSEIEVSKKLVLKVPSLEFPADGASTVSFSGAGSSPLVFTWSEVPHAEAYTIQLSHTPDFETLVGVQTLNEAELVLEQVPAGRVYWRVKGRRGPASSGWSIPRSFNGGGN